MSNLSELDALYKQIFVLDIVEKFKNCSMIWNQVAINQYSSKVSSGGVTWGVSLSKTTNGSVTLDLSKNGKYFYSVNSGDDEKVATLFAEIDASDDSSKDQDLLKDIQQLVGCGPIKIQEFMHGGARVSGAHAVISIYTPLIEGGVSSGGLSG